jgi:orotidine-5'-phosphate decarboxylase
MIVKNRVFCAVDTPEVEKADKLVSQLRGHVGGIKLGLEFFLSNGHSGYRKLAENGMPIFLDVKLHDIPNTVYGALSSLLPLEPEFVTIHTSGGAAMMKAAADAADKAPNKRPQLLGVTVLTSLDSGDMNKIGQDADISKQSLRLALLAKESGLDGVICSPAEVAILREACGADFVLMVPGIRPIWAESNDQKRIMTPKDAIKAGATHLVIGRPITGNKNPAEAADKIAQEIAE